MAKNLEGEIVASQIGNFSNTGMKYGFITIKTPKDDHVKVKIDSYTSYDTLEMGNDVIVSVEKLGSSKLIVAREIRKKK